MASDSKSGEQELYFRVNFTTYFIDSGSVMQVLGPQRILVPASNRVVSNLAAKRGCVSVPRARALAEEGGATLDMDFATSVGLLSEEMPVYYGSAREAQEAQKAGAVLSRYQAQLLAEFLRYIGESA